MSFSKLFDGFPAFITYDPKSLKPRADGKSVPDYRTINRAPTDDEFAAHLRGEKPIGRSPLKPDGNVVWGAIDIDIYEADEKVEEQIRKALLGTTGILFRSKSRGFHFVMFSEPVPAAKMVAALELIRSRLPTKVREKAKEIFPKQTSLDDVDLPTAMNLPCFGSTREIVEVWHAGRTGKLADGYSPGGFIGLAYEEMRMNAAQIDDLAAKNEDRKTRGRPVEQNSPVGFREPDDAEGRQDFLFRVGSSMRARGADMDEIKEQLYSLNKHYTEIGHPLWMGKGQNGASAPLEEKRIDSALKSIRKFEQGTPSGLHYDQVATFNAEYAVVDIEGKIEILDCTTNELRTWPLSDFRNLTANRRVKFGKSTVPIVNLWLTDVDRREYSGVVIEPKDYIGPKYNLHRGFAVAPKDGDPGVFLDYLRNVLCAGDLDLARWVEHYLADMVQRPTEQSPPTAIVIRGPQGQGKTFLFRFMATIMGPSAIEVAEADRLFARFNRSIAGCTLIGAEEAIFSGDPRLAQTLKTFISSPDWTYEAKYKAAVTMKNVHRVIATTNSEHAALIDNDDRRLTIIEVPKRWDLQTPAGQREANAFWEPYYAFMRADGPAIVLNHLLALESDQNLIRFGYINKAKADDKIMSDPVLAFLDEMADTLTLPHDMNGTGKASMKSIMERISKDAGIRARNLSAGVVSKRIRELVPVADVCRDAVYVDQARVFDAVPEYAWQGRQRGIYFGDADAFRLAVSAVTQKDYGSGEGWGRWRIDAGTPPEQPWDPTAHELKEIIGRACQ